MRTMDRIYGEVPWKREIGRRLFKFGGPGRRPKKEGSRRKGFDEKTMEEEEEVKPGQKVTPWELFSDVDKKNIT